MRRSPAGVEPDTAGRCVGHVGQRAAITPKKAFFSRRETATMRFRHVSTRDHDHADESWELHPVKHLTAARISASVSEQREFSHEDEIKFSLNRSHSSRLSSLFSRLSQRRVFLAAGSY